jgi:spore coat protein U-like protein
MKKIQTNNPKLQRALLALAIAATLAVAPPAAATLVTANFLVSANVAASCTVSASALAFGLINPSASLTPGTSTITSTCTTGTPYVVAINSGAGGGETVAARFMALGSDPTKHMNYNVYLDAGHATVWNDTTGQSATGTGVAQPLTVYGLVANGQTGISAGAYSDTLTVLVTY